MMRKRIARRSAAGKKKLAVGTFISLIVLVVFMRSLGDAPTTPSSSIGTISSSPIGSSNRAIAMFRSSMVVMKQQTTRGAAPSSLICGKLPVEKVEKCRHNYQYMVVGVTKSGTATLKEIATAHPKIRTHFMKENHFFDIGPTQLKSKSGLSLSLKDDFHSMMGVMMDNNENIHKKNDDPKDGFVYGAHSPGLLWQVVYYKCHGGGSRINLHCRGLEYQPNATAIIGRMAQVLPKETLMIAALRDPTNRAFSHFAHFGPDCADEWYGKSDPSKCFHEYVVKEIQAMQTCFDTVGRLDVNCVLLPFDHLSRGKRLVGVGLYAVFLQHWLPHFSNFCLLDVVSHGKDQAGIAREFEACLGIPHGSDLDLAYTETSHSSNVQPMWDITREMLDAFYAPYTRLLCEMAPHTCNWSWVRKAMERAW